MPMHDRPTHHCQHHARCILQYLKQTIQTPKPQQATCSGKMPSNPSHLKAPPADAADVAEVVHHDGHHRGVPVTQHVQAQLLQARPEVVGVVVELLDLARTTVSAVLTLCTGLRRKR